MFEKYDIKEIRILITNSELEFENRKKIRKYLRDELPKEQEGRYWYRERGIDVENKDTLVIFWHQKEGVGCGILHDREKEVNGEYNGFLCFYPETVFNISPISEDEIHRLSDIPKEIVQGSPKVDIGALEGVLNLIYEKWRSYSEQCG